MTQEEFASLKRYVEKYSKYIAKAVEKSPGTLRIVPRYKNQKEDAIFESMQWFKDCVIECSDSDESS